MQEIGNTKKLREEGIHEAIAGENGEKHNCLLCDPEGIHDGMTVSIESCLQNNELCVYGCTPVRTPQRYVCVCVCVRCVYIYAKY